MGGVTINVKTEVLNRANQQLTGAWGAGEVVGGIHGGGTVADIINFAILAGHHAAERASRLAQAPARMAG